MSDNRYGCTTEERPPLVYFGGCWIRRSMSADFKGGEVNRRNHDTRGGERACLKFYFVEGNNAIWIDL